MSSINGSATTYSLSAALLRSHRDRGATDAVRDRDAESAGQGRSGSEQGGRHELNELGLIVCQCLRQLGAVPADPQSADLLGTLRTLLHDLTRELRQADSYQVSTDEAGVARATWSTSFLDDVALQLQRLVQQSRSADPEGAPGFGTLNADPAPEAGTVDVAPPNAPGPARQTAPARVSLQDFLQAIARSLSGFPQGVADASSAVAGRNSWRL